MEAIKTIIIATAPNAHRHNSSNAKTPHHGPNQSRDTPTSPISALNHKYQVHSHRGRAELMKRIPQAG